MIVCWLNEYYFTREEFIYLRIWDRDVSHHMTRWRGAEQDVCILAATLLEVSNAQGVLEYIVLTLLSHITYMVILTLTLFYKVDMGFEIKVDPHCL
jgi:hypothetical protein